MVVVQSKLNQLVLAGPNNVSILYTLHCNTILNKTIFIYPIDKSFDICPFPDLQFWLFRGLSLQEGYPQPLSALSMGVNFTVRDNDQEEVGTTAEGWGLVWDPEEGPVWGRTKIFEGQEDNNTWTQLIREGVNGIIKEPDGDDPHIFLVTDVCMLSTNANQYFFLCITCTEW